MRSSRSLPQLWGDIFSMTERVRVQGYISSVWEVSSIIGPALGAFFVQYVRWAWIFWVNVPIGVLAVTGIWFFLGEMVNKREHQIVHWIGTYFHLDQRVNGRLYSGKNSLGLVIGSSACSNEGICDRNIFVYHTGKTCR